MKRNSSLLVLCSLVIGALITLGLSRLNPYGKTDSCTYVAPGGTKTTLNNQVASVDLCAAHQIGYPLKYLHSHVWIPQGSNGKVFVTAQPWIEFRTAAADWMIWSVVSAVGIGVLIYSLERAGIQTGFVNKRRH